MLTRAHTLLAMLILAGSFTWSVYGQAFGRVVIFAKSPDGSPIEGVKIIATYEGSNIRVEKTTNKKGKATLSFVDATKTYQFNFEYEGMKPLQVAIKPEVAGSITREITLDPAGDGSAGTMVEGATEARPFTAAEKAYNEGIEAMRAGDIETARSQFMTSIEKDSDLAAPHAAMSGLYIEESNYEAALAAAQRFLEIEPDSPRGLRLVYEAQRGLGNKDAADAALKALAALDDSGDAVAIIYNEGVEALKRGDRRGARTSFEQALELNPELIAAMSGLAIIHIEEKRYQEAATLAERLLALEPSHKLALRVRYDAYKELGDKAKEDEAFAALAAVDPQTLANDFFRTATDHFNGGDIEAAIQDFERAVELDPTRVKAHYQLGLCYVNTEQHAKAKEHLTKFIELAPDDPDATVAKEMLSFLN